MQTQNTPQPALIFIPDISGFTQFVTDVETTHAQHIIEELLEIIMDANDIGLEVSEVEGDAILFYRFGTAPTAAELLAQIQKMFVHFHAHLKKYATHRICNCGACKTATDLTLKCVAHYGDITLNTVKEYRKLFGKDVIIAHRLLKNQITDHEYALVTHRLVQACPQWVDIESVAWAPLREAGETYDSGHVDYCYLSLAPLMRLVPEPKAEDYSLPGVKVKVLHSEAIIEAPLEMVFNIMSDVGWRNKWVPGTIPEVQDINSVLAQYGQTHRCLAKGPVIVTHDHEVGHDVITFTETAARKTHCTVYTLKRLDENRTYVSGDAFIKKNFLGELIFRWFIRKNVLKVYDGSWVNLEAYCKALLESGQSHRYTIVLNPAESIA